MTPRKQIDYINSIRFGARKKVTNHGLLGAGARIKPWTLLFVSLREKYRKQVFSASNQVKARAIAVRKVDRG
jgi:hypothetical protein